MRQEGVLSPQLFVTYINDNLLVCSSKYKVDCNLNNVITNTVICIKGILFMTSTNILQISIKEECSVFLKKIYYGRKRFIVRIH